MSLFEAALLDCGRINVGLIRLYWASAFLLFLLSSFFFCLCVIVGSFLVYVLHLVNFWTFRIDDMGPIFIVGSMRSSLSVRLRLCLKGILVLGCQVFF